MDFGELSARVAKLAFGDNSAVISTIKPYPGNSSSVYRFEYSREHQQQAVYVKLPAPGAERPERIDRLKREFRITQNIKAEFPETSELRTVSPVGFIEDAHALVTWEIPGIALQSLLNTRLQFRIAHHRPPLEECMELAGRWLRRFHDLNPERDGLDMNRYLSYCHKRLDILSDIHNSGLSKSLAEALKEVISGWLSQLMAESKAHITLCHNDYSPHNIIVTDKGICVFDFSFSAPGLCMFDVACFWHKLEDLKYSPFYPNRTVEELQKRFLGAYQTEFDVNRPETALALMRLILSKMLSLCEFSTRRPDHWLENRRRYKGYLAFLKSRVQAGV